MWNRDQFEQSLKTDFLKQIKIIYLGISAGILIFWAVIFVIRFTVTPETTSGNGIDTNMLLFIVWLLFTVISGSAGWFFFSHPFGKIMIKSVSRNTLKSESSPDSDKIQSLFRTLFIIRLGLFQGTIFLGLVAFLISVLFGKFETSIFAKLSTIGAAIFTIGLLYMYPTQSKITEMAEMIYQAIVDEKNNPYN
jgi:hypothetical protein